MTQLKIFLVCLVLGVLGGVFYDVFYIPRSLFRRQWFRIVCDVFFCLCFGLFYSFMSVLLALPSLRAYHVLGCAIGLFLYLKSFHKIVAFFTEKLYNKLIATHKGSTGHGGRTHGRRRKRTDTG